MYLNVKKNIVFLILVSYVHRSSTSIHPVWMLHFSFFLCTTPLPKSSLWSDWSTLFWKDQITVLNQAKTVQHIIKT